MYKNPQWIDSRSLYIPLYFIRFYLFCHGWDFINIMSSVLSIYMYTVSTVLNLSVISKFILRFFQSLLTKDLLYMKFNPKLIILKLTLTLVSFVPILPVFKISSYLITDYKSRLHLSTQPLYTHPSPIRHSQFLPLVSDQALLMTDVTTTLP